MELSRCGHSLNGFHNVLGRRRKSASGLLPGCPLLYGMGRGRSGFAGVARLGAACQLGRLAVGYEHAAGERCARGRRLGEFSGTVVVICDSRV